MMQHPSDPGGLMRAIVMAALIIATSSHTVGEQGDAADAEKDAKPTAAAEPVDEKKEVTPDTEKTNGADVKNSPKADDGSKKAESIATAPALSTDAAAPVAPPRKSEPDLFTRTSEPLADVPSYGAALVRMFVVLASILIVLVLLAKFLPRWLGRSLTSGRSGAIRVIDSVQLEPRRRIYLLRVGDQHVLVGSSEQGIHTLAGQSLDNQRLAEAIKGGDAGATKPSLSFASVLGSKDTKRAAPDGD